MYLAAHQKSAACWLMLWLSQQVAQGKHVWNLSILQCDVLYLCLEDTTRRIKDRLYQLSDDAPNNLHFAVACGRVGSGLEGQIIEFLKGNSNTTLFIIDTLQKVRDSKSSFGKNGIYASDYDDIASIKQIADQHGIAILLVHHLRKLQDASDPFNEVTGSTGIIGAADTNFVLKHKRSNTDAVLFVSGRDVEYQEMTLRFRNLVWELVERKDSKDIHNAEITDFVFQLADFMKDQTHWTGTASELLTAMVEKDVDIFQKRITKSFCFRIQIIYFLLRR